MKHITEYKTLGVLFSPFLGGNHLANMLSTSEHIADRKKVDNYKDYVLSYYKNNHSEFKNVHINEFSLFGVEDWTKAYNLVESNNLTTILPGHVDDGFWVLNKLKPLGPMGIITLEIYNPDSIYSLTSRLKVKDYNPYMYRFLYRKDVVHRLFDLSPDDVYAISMDDYFKEDIDTLLNQINSEFKLQLDIEFCKELHVMWYTKIKGTL